MLAHSPSEIHTLFAEAFNRADVEGLAALYEPNGVLINRGEQLAGREAIRDAYRIMLGRQGRMELQTRSVVESSDGLALLHAAWKLEWSTADGRTSLASGISSEVVRRQPDGRWLFVLDEPSTPSP